MLRIRVWLLALIFLVAGASNTLAEGFALYEYGARGVALGGAMMARTPDPSAVAFNPALITKLPGQQFMAGFTGIHPVGKMRWEEENGTGGTTELRPGLWAIPHFYYTHQINDDLYFGIGEFTRFGLGFEYPHDWPGRFNIYEVSLVSGSLNPNLAWKVTDKLSIAAGVELVYVDLDLKKRSKFDVPNPFGPTSMEVDTSITEATAWGVGGNIALHYDITDQWAIGLQYRSHVRVHAFGDTEFSYLGLSGAAAGVGPVEAGAHNTYQNTFKDGTAHSVVVLPESISGGIAFTPNEDFSIEVGAVWTRWSRFRGLNIHMPNGLPTAKNPKDWENVWRFNVGVEYKALDWLTLRAGYVWDQSPMTSKFEDYLVPTDDRNIYSLGVGFHGENWNLDLAYAFIDPGKRNYNRNDITKTVTSRSKSTRTELFSVSLSYSF